MSGEAKIESNRLHHHEWYAREHSQLTYEAARLCIDFRALMHEASEFIKKIERTEAARQENAVLMSVPVIESNSRYGAESIKAHVETMIKALQEFDRHVSGGTNDK